MKRMSLAKLSGFFCLIQGFQILSVQMPSTRLNIIVCVDARRCLALNFRGRNSLDLLRDLQEHAETEGLGQEVQATPCQCIFGCTYGPRIDVINRDSHRKTLYGAVSGTVSISVRGRVQMEQIPEDLQQLIQDNLN